MNARLHYKFVFFLYDSPLIKFMFCQPSRSVAHYEKRGAMVAPGNPACTVTRLRIFVDFLVLIVFAHIEK